MVVTVAVRGTPIASATSPNQSPAGSCRGAARLLGLPGEPGEEHVEPVAFLALRDDRPPGRDLLPLHPLSEPRERLARRDERSPTRESSVTDAGTWRGLTRVTVASLPLRD